MESGFCSRRIHLWMVIFVFRSISADPAQPPRYTVHTQQVSFDQAMKHCSPGVLTTISTPQEVSEIYQQVSLSLPALVRKNFTFWVGLRKAKRECVVLSQPLRGFKWAHDGSQDSQVSRWAVEPQSTCTSVLCAALKGEFNGTSVTGWGLIADSCKSTYQFICKLSSKTSKDGETASEPGQEPALPEPEPFTTTPEPAIPEPLTPAAPTAKKPDPKPETPKPETEPESEPKTEPEPEPEPSTLPKTGLNYTYPGSEPQGPDPDPVKGKDSCEHPKTTQYPGIRSVILGNSSWIKIECWSSVVVELHCLGHPIVWRLLDGSPVNFSSVCLPCKPGFLKNALGDCVDIDECSVGNPCRHKCLNTEGSYRCVCSDENGEDRDEDSEACRHSAMVDQGFPSGLLILVLIAVAALVVLLVIVSVTVRCCLMRQSKKRAMEKAEKMAMESKENKDSYQTANEQTAT
ncbi:C-type lectin domain family 14 member A [Halichoeres trimaculatus]|uniref:C-type lectin domain family 14 member A n=1 Tax=Halichoeres trimaculatus TaxID=147232 RepID=UPI003D9E9A71